MIVLLLIAIQILVLTFSLGILWFYIEQLRSIHNGAPFVTLKRTDVTQMIALAHIKKGQILYDLGSGDGRILFAASRAGAIARGIEINTFAVLLTRLKARLLHVKNVSVLRKSFFDANLGDADVIFLYLLPGLVAKLAPKLQRELKSGALVVSKGFPIPDWQPRKVVGNIYLYETKY